MTSVDIYEGSCGRSEHRRTNSGVSPPRSCTPPAPYGDAPTYGDPVTVLASPLPDRRVSLRSVSGDGGYRRDRGATS